ncbi:MAG TPA: hypothetical protein GXZ76_02620 [Clostridiaceae bacterium]|nr:hypothetical protein [Clostridiaceae bacterium]
MDEINSQPENKQEGKQADNSNLTLDSVDNNTVNKKNNAGNITDFSPKELADNINNSEYIYDLFENYQHFTEMYADLYRKDKSNKSYNPHLTPDELFIFQKPGWRILKTTIAVFICLMISLIDIGDNSGVFHAFHACIAAIITLKSNLKNTWKVGLYRVGSTTFGALMGLVAIQIRIIFNLANHCVQYYLIVTGLLFLIIWFTVLIRATEMTALAAVVFLLIALSQSANQTADPREYAFFLGIYRFLYTIIGISVAYLVNWALPPYARKKSEMDMTK